MATVMAAPAPTEEAVAEPVADLEGQEHLLLHLLWKHQLKKAYKYGYPPPPPYGYSPYSPYNYGK